MENDLQAQIADAEERLRLAMLASDVDALDDLLSSGLVFTNHLGQRLDKETDLEAHKSGALKLSKLEPSEQYIKILSSDAAIVSVRVQVSGKYAGQPAGGNFRFTRVWTLSPDKRWQVAAAHAGIIA